MADVFLQEITLKPAFLKYQCAETPLKTTTLLISAMFAVGALETTANLFRTLTTSII